jgi:hypothetical protein
MANFRLTGRRAEEIIAAVEACAGLYEDLDLLVHEYICLAPNLDDHSLRVFIGQWSLGIVQRHLQSNPRLAAAASLSFGRLGRPDELVKFRASWSKSGQQTPLFVQGLVILKGAGLLRHLRWTVRCGNLEPIRVERTFVPSGMVTIERSASLSRNSSLANGATRQGTA